MKIQEIFMKINFALISCKQNIIIFEFYFFILQFENVNAALNIFYAARIKKRLDAPALTYFNTVAIDLIKNGYCLLKFCVIDFINFVINSFVF